MPGQSVSKDYLSGISDLVELASLPSYASLLASDHFQTFLVTTYTAGMTLTWAVQGQDVTVLNATERILAEGVALIIALAAVWFLQWWGKQRQVEQHVEAAIAS